MPTSATRLAHRITTCPQANDTRMSITSVHDHIVHSSQSIDADLKLKIMLKRCRAG